MAHKATLVLAVTAAAALAAGCSAAEKQAPWATTAPIAVPAHTCAYVVTGPPPAGSPAVASPPAPAPPAAGSSAAASVGAGTDAAAPSARPSASSPVAPGSSPGDPAAACASSCPAVAPGQQSSGSAPAVSVSGAPVPTGSACASPSPGPSGQALAADDPPGTITCGKLAAAVADASLMDPGVVDEIARTSATADAPVADAAQRLATAYADALTARSTSMEPDAVAAVSAAAADMSGVCADSGLQTVG